MKKEKNNLMEKIISLCKRRGFVFPGSEIYGGITGMWDYGPAGVLLRKNLKDFWWKELVQMRDDMVGIDAAIIMNPRAWEASGHTSSFSDPLVECKICHLRFRHDKEEEIAGHENTHKGKKVEWTEPQQFNLLVKTYLGIIEGKQQEVFLRGEITNGVSVNFKNIVNSTRVKIPFGIAQIGKAFRNEITPGGFIFRDREFEQMETQFFIKPIKEEGEKWFEYWKQNRMEFLLSLGVNKKKFRFKDHEKLAHYAKAATDIEYEYPWGFDEIMGIHNRADWDLSRHQEYSGEKMEVLDTQTGETFIPWDIETSSGVDRLMLVLLLDAYREEGERIWLSLSVKIAPYKIAVFPLLGNKPELIDKAKEVFNELKKDYMVAWDDRGNIGKRYAAQDEIGTPYCVTVDFDTLEKGEVTVRDRDTMKQEKVKVEDLKKFITEKIYA
ncbi:MAG: glycine--tRNA ligase [Candidatus Staskawiczbacteria bacterium]|nr:glycine--tRNA ligase [Candidatus Staskawiczbacteria bacterium]